MNEFASNVSSGLLGALIGGLVTYFAVRQQAVIQRKSELRNILLEQRVAVRMAGHEDSKKKLAADYLRTLQAYENLKSLLYFRDRKRICECWRKYKGNIDDFVPLFGIQTSYPSETSCTVTSHNYDRNEIMENIDFFLEYLTH